jgi:hypothetical protein
LGAEIDRRAVFLDAAIAKAFLPIADAAHRAGGVRVSATAIKAENWAREGVENGAVVLRDVLPSQLAGRPAGPNGSRWVTPRPDPLPPLRGVFARTHPLGHGRASSAGPCIQRLEVVSFHELHERLGEAMAWLVEQRQGQAQDETQGEVPGIRV